MQRVRPATPAHHSSVPDRKPPPAIAPTACGLETPGCTKSQMQSSERPLISSHPSAHLARNAGHRLAERGFQAGQRGGFDDSLGKLGGQAILQQARGLPVAADRIARPHQDGGGCTAGPR